MWNTSADCCWIPKLSHPHRRPPGKEETAIGIFQYDIREAAVTAEGDMIVFVRFVAMDFQDKSGIQRWLGNITQYRFMIPIKLTDFLTQHDATGNVLFVVVRHAEECQTENLFVLRQLCQQASTISPK